MFNFAAETEIKCLQPGTNDRESMTSLIQNPCLCYEEHTTLRDINSPCPLFLLYVLHRKCYLDKQWLPTWVFGPHKKGHKTNLRGVTRLKNISATQNYVFLLDIITSSALEKYSNQRRKTYFWWHWSQPVCNH